jgi:hypothetical protein
MEKVKVSFKNGTPNEKIYEFLKEYKYDDLGNLEYIIKSENSSIVMGTASGYIQYLNYAERL